VSSDMQHWNHNDALPYWQSLCWMPSSVYRAKATEESSFVVLTIWSPVCGSMYLNIWPETFLSKLVFSSIHPQRKGSVPRKVYQTSGYYYLSHFEQKKCNIDVYPVIKLYVNTIVLMSPGTLRSWTILLPSCYRPLSRLLQNSTNTKLFVILFADAQKSASRNMKVVFKNSVTWLNFFNIIQ
jgi:hypothetical protein